MQQIAGRKARSNEMAVLALLQDGKTARSGLGQTSEPSGTSRNTLAPMPIMAEAPIDTFCRTVARGPINETSPTVQPPAKNAPGATVTFRPIWTSCPRIAPAFTIANASTLLPKPKIAPGATTAPRATPAPLAMIADGETKGGQSSSCWSSHSMIVCRAASDSLVTAPIPKATPSYSRLSRSSSSRYPR